MHCLYISSVSGHGAPIRRVDRRTLDSRPDQLVNELLLDILNDHALGSELSGLGLDGLEVLLLTAVGKEAHDLVTLQDQPTENGTCVEACYVNEYKFVVLYLLSVPNLPPE